MKRISRLFWLILLLMVPYRMLADLSPSSRSHTSSHRSSKAVRAKASPAPKPSPTATPKPSPKPEPSASPTPTPPTPASPSPASTSSKSTEDTKGSLSPIDTKSVASLKPVQLRDFDTQPPKVQELIRNSLALTERNLGYQYGSADPAQGGMDCSGFIYYILSGAGFKDVPRQSSDQYLWVRRASDFHAVLSRDPDTFELKEMQPGDLMFWSGTYAVDRDVPISHVMIYLGREKSTGRPVMVGASDGRTYDGRQRFGVSVFDFKLPTGNPNKSDPDLVAKFEGYASIPGLRNPTVASSSTLTEPASNGKSRSKPSPASEPLTDGD
jgi:peptidoglycan DL-endopeptidase CwlO